MSSFYFGGVVMETEEQQATIPGIRGGFYESRERTDTTILQMR
jgi:hypothetical protein